MTSAARRRTLVRLALAAAWLPGCGGGGGGGNSPSTSTPDPATPSNAGNGISTLTVQSRYTGVLYPVTVYQPADAQTGTPPPVVYFSDAETMFNTLMGVVQAYNFRVTLVGLANPTTFQRQVDLLEPGAEQYYSFIVDQLAPLIESKFRVDPTRRILSGHSSGGLFVGYALFKESPTNRRFFAYISADGSFWQQPDAVSQGEAAMFAANAASGLPVTAVFGGDAQGNVAYVQPLYNMIAERKYSSLKAAFYAYNFGHVPMYAPFFHDALSFIFQG